MNKEQAEQEYKELRRKWVNESEQIIEQAKKEGKLKPGLDSDRELFVETDKKFMDAIKKLQESVGEE